MWKFAAEWSLSGLLSSGPNLLRAYIIPSSGQWKYLLTFWHLVSLGSSQPLEKLKTRFAFFQWTHLHKKLLSPKNSTIWEAARLKFLLKITRCNRMSLPRENELNEIKWHCLRPGCDLADESLHHRKQWKHNWKKGKAQNRRHIWIFSHTLPLFF